MTTSVFSKIRICLILQVLLLSWGTSIGPASYQQQLQHPELTAAQATPGEALRPLPHLLADVFLVLFQSDGWALGVQPSRLIPASLSAAHFGNAVPTRSRPPPAS